ncbi:MAG TPA: hypothetical protein EYM84_01455 [Flavobacteriales bacterium]|nr:hypothetical protein [Flavobacteriales bacterium]
MKKCLYCNTPMEGRIDKLYCNPNCKSLYHYQKSREQGGSLYNQIDAQLKLNRRTLKNYNRGGKVTVRKEELEKEGFNPNYFTHYWKAANGNIYLFCYEYGFMERLENGRAKYVLVQWQEYMKK